MNQELTKLAAAMRAELARLPKKMLQEEVARQAIICLLWTAVGQMGLIPVASWKPPKSTRDRIDLVGVVPDSDPPQIQVAFVVDPLVELAKVKALEWVFCDSKVVVTFSERRDKVDQSTFFLNKDLTHLHIFD